jgi:hypothetical protein
MTNIRYIGQKEAYGGDHQNRNSICTMKIEGGMQEE